MDEQNKKENKQKKSEEKNKTTIEILKRMYWFNFDEYQCFQITKTKRKKSRKKIFQINLSLT